MTNGFIAVGKTSDVAAGQMKWVAVDRERLLLVNVEGAFYALSDACGHQRVPLSGGRLDGYVVECPLHFACFDVRTGRLLSGPIADDVPIHEVHVDGDVIYVKRRMEPRGW
ncbi:MAG TPA: non-heme iron oxygenase ferredoxin subunit [Candidatus Methylomirabilis sp.]|nr:non-heme iron oxygenase ferredoxin subunit [Candidatus Methylomirabilis sp.]